MTIESAITFFKNNAYLFLFSSILLLPVKNSVLLKNLWVKKEKKRVKNKA